LACPDCCPKWKCIVFPGRHRDGRHRDYPNVRTCFPYQIFYDGEAEPKKIKGLNLDGEKLSLGERREIESLGRKFTKLKDRDKGLVRLMIAKLLRATS
jgi:hypothetical protein